MIDKTRLDSRLLCNGSLSLYYTIYVEIYYGHIYFTNKPMKIIKYGKVHSLFYF